MTNNNLSRHARQRMRQRGMRERDVELVLHCGTGVGTEFMFSDRDADREITDRKREIEALERLRGCKVIVKHGVVVTCFRATHKQQKAVMRRHRDNGWREAS